MARPRSDADKLAPIFVVIDDDKDAAMKMTGMLYPANCFFITVTDPKQGVRYADCLGTTAVLLADPVEYPRGGTARLLQEILDVEKPVVILSEDWSPESVDRWKRMGARDCIPHPTRMRRRLKHVARLIQAFTFARIREKQEGARGAPEKKEV